MKGEKDDGQLRPHSQLARLFAYLDEHPRFRSRLLQLLADLIEEIIRGQSS